MSHKSNLKDLEVFLHHQTDRAYLVSLDGDKSDAVWLPKSQCEINGPVETYSTLTLPEWLALEKGLL